MLRHSRRSTRASASSRHRGVLSLPQTSSRALPRGLCSRSRGRTVHDGGHGRRQAAGGWRAASGARGRGCGDGGGRWSCQSRRDAGAGGANQWRRPRGACRPQLRRRAAIGRRQRWEVLLRVGRRLGRRRCPWCVDAGASGGSWGGHTGGGCGCGCGGYGTLTATKGRPRRSCGNRGTWEGYVSEPGRWPHDHNSQPHSPQPRSHSRRSHRHSHRSRSHSHRSHRHRHRSHRHSQTQPDTATHFCCCDGVVRSRFSLPAFRPPYHPTSAAGASTSSPGHPKSACCMPSPSVGSPGVR